jgi:DtxR family Mn-dependent transcriptional regulator
VSRQLSEALEDYLEAIFRIEREKRFARVSDIATAVGVGKSAVTTALRGLAERGLVNYQPYEPVTLSEEGRRVAARIAVRHHVLKDFLQRVLDLAPERADAVACGMEHAMDADVLERLTCFLAFVGRADEGGASRLEEFRRFLHQRAQGNACEQCVQRYLRAAEALG